MQKILLINFGGIGDEVLFLPVIKSLKQKFQNSEITLCLEPRSKGIKDLCNDIDKLILTDIKSKNKYIELFKFYIKALTGKYDMVISSGANKLIPVLLFFTGIKTRIGYNSGSFTNKLLTKAVPLNKSQFAGKMYYDLVKDLTNEEYENPEIKIEKSEKTEGMIIVHPGVSKMSIQKNIIKSFGYEKWAELVEALLNNNEKVAIAGGPDDDECISAILEKIKDKNYPNFYNFYGKTKNLQDLASLMAGAKTVICCDSAPMHIAVACNVKTIALFGPTDEKKLVPDKDNITVITSECTCRPCLWDKRNESCKTKECIGYSIDKIISSI